MWTATFYLQGAVSQWYYRWEKNHGVPDWKAFVDGVHKRFGPPSGATPSASSLIASARDPSTTTSINS